MLQAGLPIGAPQKSSPLALDDHPLVCHLLRWRRCRACEDPLNYGSLESKFREHYPSITVVHEMIQQLTFKHSTLESHCPKVAWLELKLLTMYVRIGLAVLLTHGMLGWCNKRLLLCNAVTSGWCIMQSWPSLHHPSVQRSAYVVGC